VIRVTVHAASGGIQSVHESSKCEGWRGANVKHDHKHDQEPALKGTFVAVLTLGVILAVSWTAVFLLFINR